MVLSPRKIGLILFYNGPLSGKPRLEKRAYRSPVSNRYSTPTGESARTLHTHRATIYYENEGKIERPSMLNFPCRRVEEARAIELT